MKILKVHNFYTQPGGEDTVYQGEVTLLRSRGHEVVEYLDFNKRIEGMNKASVALQTIWSQPSFQRMEKILHKEKPDIVHFDNTFPLISPSVYYACKKLNVPVVQRLHNQRLICPASSFYRKGKLCLDCLGKIPPWPSVLHACYHDSRPQTAVVASMSMFHYILGTWQTKVDIFLCSTNFYRDLFVQAGFPSNKIVVLPLFDQNEFQSSSVERKEDYALFLGRLDPEKGVRTLLDAWRFLDFPLKIRGSGGLDEEARAFVRQHDMSNVEFVERMSEQELSDLICNARFLISPSEGYYETFGLVIVEAYSRGVPVVASDNGVTPELVINEQTGLLFEQGNARDLADKSKWMWSHPAEAIGMGVNGLNIYKERYTQERYYQNLIQIYETLVNSK